MSPLGEMILRHLQDIATLFAEPLAERTGCSAEDIRRRGLDAGAFRPGQELRLTLADGSTMHLRHAFFVEDEAKGLVGVFSEHCGYHVFRSDDLRIEQVDDGVVTLTRT